METETTSASRTSVLIGSSRESGAGNHPLEGVTVSFDFDNTLSRPDVQDYAAELIKRGVTVWVVTSRFDENHKHRYPKNPSNADLWLVIDSLGIPRYRVRFQNMRPKAEYLANTHILWHLDDDWIENDEITKQTKTLAVSSMAGGWRHKCDKLLKRQGN